MYVCEFDNLSFYTHTHSHTRIQHRRRHGDEHMSLARPLRGLRYGGATKYLVVIDGGFWTEWSIPQGPSATYMG